MLFPALVEIERGKYPNIKALETIACRCTQGKDLWTCIRDAYLEVSVCVFLFEYYANGFFHVNEETPWRSRLFVVRETA